MIEFFIVLIGAGLLLLVVGHLWLVTLAFKQGAGWGLGCLIVPFVSVVFLILYWDEAKRPFLFAILGGALAGAGFAGVGPDNLSRVTAVGLPSGRRTTPTPRNPLLRTTTGSLGPSSVAYPTPTATTTADPLQVPDALPATPKPQAPPAGMLPPPLPPAARTHLLITVGELDKYHGRSMRVRMKDGRVVIGYLLGVDHGIIKMDRELGRGIAAFQLPVEDVQEILLRL
jgi:hypothetical protein